MGQPPLDETELATMLDDKAIDTLCTDPQFGAQFFGLATNLDQLKTLVKSEVDAAQRNSPVLTGIVRAELYRMRDEIAVASALLALQATPWPSKGAINGAPIPGSVAWILDKLVRETHMIKTMMTAATFTFKPAFIRRPSSTRRSKWRSTRRPRAPRPSPRNSRACHGTTSCTSTTIT